MNKALFIFLIFCITVVLNTCDLSEYYYYTVKNNSEKKVFYTFNGSPDSLAPDSDAKNYPIKRGKHHTTISVDTEKTSRFGISVILASNGTNYIFKDGELFLLKAKNTLSTDITLKSEYFKDIDEAGLFIPAHEEDEENVELDEEEIDENEKVYVYTNNPVFSVLPGYYNIILDQKFEDNTVHLVIKSP